MTPSTRSTLAALAAIALFAAAGCGGSDQGEVTARALPATSASTPTSAATSNPTPAGCSGGDGVVPAGAVNGAVPDVDGDGRDDTAWLVLDPSGQVRAGVVTAAGGGASRVWESASPVTRSLFVTRVNDTTPAVILASDGRLAQLWAVVDCALVDVSNQQGQRYEFSLGVTEFGTGVGCTTVDGTVELVGLNITGDDGTTVTWTSTVVDIDGDDARNGTTTSGTFTRPADDRSIALLSTIACGSRTIRADGLTLAP